MLWPPLGEVPALRFLINCRLFTLTSFATTAIEAPMQGSISFYEDSISRGSWYAGPLQGVVWDVDLFDQWGVELGKVLANRIVPEVVGQPKLQHGSSTNSLIRRYHRLKGA